MVLGPPGCGKTTHLLQQLERVLKAGVSPQRVAFVSFTRAAVKEARDRAMTEFKLTVDDLPHFRTLHSLAFRALGLRRDEVFGRDGLKELSELTGEELTGHVDATAPTLGERGDALLFLDQLARNTLRPLRDVWYDHESPIDWFRLKRFTDAYALFRSDRYEHDFTDMLERYADHGAPLDVDVVFIDEAQDLSPLQWKVALRAFDGVRELWVAGDDDQAIFTWAGADVEQLLNFDGEKRVLSQSHRLPRAVFDLARSVANQIGRRFEKPFHPTDRIGSVEHVASHEEVDLSTGQWRMMARTRRQLAELAATARDQGVAYAVMGKSAIDPDHLRLIEAHEERRKEDGSLPIWHDALTEIPIDDREYLLACRRRGESLRKVPRVQIDTIHGSKGKEADHVLLLTDLNARVRRAMDLDPDAEQRVLYVGVTRAIETLTLVAPKRSRMGYQL